MQLGDNKVLNCMILVHLSIDMLILWINKKLTIPLNLWNRWLTGPGMYVFVSLYHSGEN